MIIKKEIIEKLISFSNSQSKLLLLDTNSTDGLVKVVLKVLINEIKDPQKIGFISSEEKFFTEVFPKTQISIKQEIDYILSNHKISFYTLTTNLIKNPSSNIEIFIIYPIETLDDKSLVKFINNSKNHKKIILVTNDSKKNYKNILKLKPTFITLQEDNDTSYYNKMKKSINSYK